MKKRIKQVGDIRLRKGFLFLPRSIDGDLRWLEYAYWKQICILDMNCDIYFVDAEWMSPRMYYLSKVKYDR